MFYDVSPLINDGKAFGKLIEAIAEPLHNRADKVACFDARGFLFGGAVASLLGIGCVMLRKPNKLAGETYTVNYDLEYGSASLQVQKDVIKPSEAIVLVDDVIATGGTALAGIELMRQCGAKVIEFCSVVDLPYLGGSQKIQSVGIPVRSIASYEEKM
jgi:adenine phosphoribosyltransferase